MSSSDMIFVVWYLVHVFYDFEVCRLFLRRSQFFPGMSFGLPVRKAHRSTEKNIHQGYFSTAPAAEKTRRSLEKRHTERNKKHVSNPDTQKANPVQTKEPFLVSMKSVLQIIDKYFVDLLCISIIEAGDPAVFNNGAAVIQRQ